MTQKAARPVTRAGTEEADEASISVAQRPVITRRPIRDQGRNWTLYGPIGRWSA